MTKVKYFVVIALALLALCAVSALAGDDKPTCSTGTSYKCPYSGEWRCKCPKNYGWCYDRRDCIHGLKESPKDYCNSRCVRGRMLSCGTCKCHKGWTGPRCDKKVVKFRYSKKYHKHCDKDVDCTKTVTIKCRCDRNRRHKSRSGRRYRYDDRYYGRGYDKHYSYGRRSGYNHKKRSGHNYKSGNKGKDNKKRTNNKKKRAHYKNGRK